MLPAIEPTSTMALPSPISRIARCTASTMARTFRLKARSKCASVVSSRLAGSATPDELTRMSRRPALACSVSNSCARSSAWVRSPAMVSICPSIEATASASCVSRRPVIKTRAPSRANRRAIARPIPLLPPVIRATFPRSFIRVTPDGC